MKSDHSKYNDLLDDAAHAIAADQRDCAADCIETVLAEVKSLPDAWLVKAWTANSLDEAADALNQALAVDGKNEVAVAGLKWIEGLREFATNQLLAKRQAEEEARQKAAAEAKRQAEEEARQKAAAEAKRQTEEEARQKAAAEAKRQAEEEARQKAAAEAKRQAEEEARQKAAAEAKRQAEEEARQKAAAEAKRQAEEERQLKLAAEQELQAELAQQAELESQSNRLEAEATTQNREAADTPDACQTEAELKESLQTLVQEIQDEIGEGGDLDKPVSSVSQSHTKKQIILAVDDSPTIRKLLSLTLTSEGYEVITAADGIEALNVLSECVPDMILTDINMPKLNGYKLCKFVKKHARTQSIPVVMLSGKDGVFDKMRGKMNGCDDFMTKPFESSELVAKVRDTLSRVVSQ